MNLISWFAEGGWSWFIHLLFVLGGIAFIFLGPKYINDPPYFSFDYWGWEYENIAHQEHCRERDKKISRAAGWLLIAVGSASFLLRLLAA